MKAEKHVEHFGVPMCDFKKYDRNEPTSIIKFRRAVEHVIILNKLNKKTKCKLLDLLDELQLKLKKEKLENKKRQMRRLNRQISTERYTADQMANKIKKNLEGRRKSNFNVITKNNNTLVFG